MEKFAKREPLYRQIATHFEEQIHSGKLKPGERLPSTAKLAKEFGVTVDTMQQSLKILCERGLLDRQQKKGTFVSQHVLTKTIGIVFGKRIFTDANFAFFNLFLDEITSYLEDLGWDTKYYPLKDDGNHSKFLFELEHDIREGKVSGLFEFCSDFDFREYVKNNHCPVPWHDYIMDVDFSEFTAMALEHLNSKKINKIAILAPNEEFVTSGPIVDQIARYSQLNPSLDIEIFSHACFDEEGYDAVKSKFPSKPYPEAIIVCRDSACRGVIYGLLESGLKIQDDITLVTHRNKGIKIFSPKPLTYLETDPADFAKAAVNALIGKINGIKSKPILLPPTLITNED